MRTARPDRRSGETAALLPIACALALLPLIGCGSTAATSPELPEVEPDPTEIRRGDFARELLLTGELRAVRSVAIKSPQTNLFQLRIQFMAEEGEFAAVGEPLLAFDNSSLAEQVRDLESRILDAETSIVTRRNELASSLKDLEIELAEKDFENERAKLEASVDPEVLSRKEFGERQLAMSSASRELEQTLEEVELTRSRGEASLDILRINRDKLKKDLLVAGHDVELLSVNAPTAGLVVYERRPGTTLRFREGDSCWPGQSVMRLPDLSEMQVEFNVNEVDAPLLDVGMQLRITLDSFPGRELAGEVVRIPSMAVKRDESSKIAVFKVLADLSETWVGEMKPGMSALGRIVVEQLRDVPLVVRERVRFDGERYWLRPSDPEDAPIPINPVARNARYYVLSEDDYARVGGVGTEVDS